MNYSWALQTNFSNFLLDILNKRPDCELEKEMNAQA